MSDNGWNEYQNLVLAELKRLNSWLEKLDERMDKFEITAAVIATKQKASMAIYGAIGGALPVAIGLAVWIIKSG